MNHRSLFAAKESSGDGKEDANRFGDERLQTHDFRHFDAVQIALDLGYATAGGTGLREHAKRRHEDEGDVEGDQ